MDAMPESSRTQLPSSANQSVIVIDDDDDVVMAPNGVQSHQAQSPSNSLTNLTPAMSVAISSSGSLSQHSGSSSSAALDKYRTGYVFSNEMMLHSNPIDPDHPEKPIRIWKIYTRLHEQSLLKRMKRIKIREVTEDEVKLVHDKGMWDGIEKSAFIHPDLLREQVQMLENASSLYINEYSAFAARLSCGGAIELCDAIASDRIHNGFAIIRPPGHHAEPHKSMGFCFYNNVAVATKFLKNKYPETIRKVLILDWDVHHGNGTQRAFEDDPDVLYISLHRYDEDGSFYPGSVYGNYDSAGTGRGEGKSVNVPWPTHGMGDADYLYAFQHLVMPIALEFAPDFVIISAGFDAALGDPIGLNRITPGGYAQMTHALTSLCKGKLAVILEGGYNPDAVAESALAVTQVILFEEPAPPSTTIASTIAAKTVQQVCRYHSRYWKSIKIPDIEVDDVDSDSASAPPKMRLGELMAEYRNTVIGSKYGLFNLSMLETNHYSFEGQIMCSEGILDEYSTIVFFVHDMGNVRCEKPRLGTTVGGEAQMLVDASTLVLDYAKSRGYGVVDMNMMKEFSAIKPVVPEGRRPGMGFSSSDEERLRRATEAAAFVWDNVVALAKSARGPKHVVLVGFGTGCNVAMRLIDARKAPSQIAAIVNVVGYDRMPCVDADRDLGRKKWYYSRSKVLVPADHPHILERADSVPLKRFGRITPVEHVRAVNILSHTMPDISAFIDKKLRLANAS